MLSGRDEEGEVKAPIGDVVFEFFLDSRGCLLRQLQLEGYFQVLLFTSERHNAIRNGHQFFAMLASGKAMRLLHLFTL